MNLPPEGSFHFFHHLPSSVRSSRAERQLNICRRTIEEVVFIVIVVFSKLSSYQRLVFGYIAILSRWYNGKHRFHHCCGISIIHECLLSILAYFIDSFAEVDRIYFGSIDGLIFVPAQQILIDGIVICRIAKTT